MKKWTYSRYYFIKGHKKLKNGKAPVYVRITLNGRSWEKGLHISALPENWNSKKERETIKGSIPSLSAVNKAIESVEFRLKNLEIKFDNEGKTLTMLAIKTELNGGEKLSRSILRLFDNHNEKIKERIGIDITHATYIKYVTCRNHFKEFLLTKHKAEDIPASEITKDLFEDFELFLKQNKNCSHNTTIKYIRNFNKIIRKAKSKGWIQVNPYEEIKYREEKIEKPNLTEEELNIIINKKISIERLSVIRDVFLFCCYSDLQLCNFFSVKS